MIRYCYSQNVFKIEIQNRLKFHGLQRQQTRFQAGLRLEKEGIEKKKEKKKGSIQNT